LIVVSIGISFPENEIVSSAMHGYPREARENTWSQFSFLSLPVAFEQGNGVNAVFYRNNTVFIRYPENPLNPP